MPFLLGLAQGFTPGDCILTGLCGVKGDPPSAASGVLFIALGLVLYGAHGLWRSRRRRL